MGRAVPASRKPRLPRPKRTSCGARSRSPAAPAAITAADRSDAQAAAGIHARDPKTVRVGSQEVVLRWCPATKSAEWKRLSGGNDTFTMGSPDTEDGHENDETQHDVRLTKGFWMGETEVTQGLWKEVMGSNPSYNKAGDKYPVENVSWKMCQYFIEKLNARTEVRGAGFRFRLPTEAQWGYACRAGTTTSYSYGNSASGNYMWYKDNSSSQTHEVGTKSPNPWGLYDMHGNVWEWCLDWYASSLAGGTDPKGSSSGSSRMLCGGSWSDYAGGCTSSSLLIYYPSYKHDHDGFRLSRTLNQ